MPLLIDGDFVLFESRAIARYIALKYAHQGPPLIPMGLKEQAIFEQAVSIETSQFEPVAAAINFERRLKKCVTSRDTRTAINLQAETRVLASLMKRNASSWWQI